MKVKLHFNRINMARRLREVWSAHTYRSCNSSEQVLIRHKGKIIGRTIFKPDAKQPRAFIELDGEVVYENGHAIIDVS
jgi:hypothetical protein